MYVKLQLPSEETSVLLKKLEIIHSDTDINIFDKHVPRGDSSFIFNLEGRVFIQEKELITLPEMFIAPNLIKAINLNVTGSIFSFIAICKTSVLSRLYNIDMTLEDGCLYQKVPHDIFEPVYNSLRKIKDDVAKFNFFEEYLLKTVLLNKKYVPDEIDSIYDYICEKAVYIPLENIRNSIPFSERSFRRNFVKRVGVNAKTLARICRVNYLWEKAESSSAIDYGALVFYGGYFDQAHFIKDFKSIVCETPGHFFKRNREQVKIMSGK